MTVDVMFGVLVNSEDDEGRLWVDWPGKARDEREPDGTSAEYTLYPGRPHRPFSSHGYYEFVKRVPAAKAIHDLCKPLYPNSNDIEWRKVDNVLLGQIDKLPLTDGGIDTDRAKWYKYWAHRAKIEFGEAAVIFIY